MPTVTKKNAHNLPDPGFGGVAYGNMFALSYAFATNTSGIFVDSDKATAVGDGDKVVLGKIPAGTRLVDMIAVISDAFTATIDFDIGFEYCDGVDVAAVPQDDNFFAAAADAGAAAVLRKATTTAPVTIPKDAYLILTSTNAAHASAGRIDIDIIGIIGGPH